MGISGGPNILGDENLTFIYDLADPNSYAGEPTTNIYGTSFKDFTGTTYSPDGEWTSNPTQLTKTYNSTLPTPIGLGATLIQESGSTGYHHLSRYGGGNESGLHTISCYIYPLTSSITDFNIGMLADSVNTIRFNLDTRQITYGAAISNRNAIIQDVPGWPGWLRVGANIEGRAGGWVGALGYSIDSSYTGTSGAKKCYITGIQYEYKDHVTQFTTGTRSVSGSLFDLSISNTITSVSGTLFDSNAQPIFNGTSSFISAPIPTQLGNTDYSIEFTLLVATSSAVYGIFLWGSGPFNLNGIGTEARFQTNQFEYTLNDGTGVGTRLQYSFANAANNQYRHYTLTQAKQGTATLYVNGASVATQNYTTESLFTNTNTLLIGRSTDGFLNGRIANFKVYNRALSASEVFQNYNNIKSRFNI